MARLMLQGTGKAFADLITICDNHVARESRIDARRELTKANERLGVHSLDSIVVPAAEAKKHLDGLIKRPDMSPANAGYLTTIRGPVERLIAAGKPGEVPCIRISRTDRSLNYAQRITVSARLMGDEQRSLRIIGNRIFADLLESLKATHGLRTYHEARREATLADAAERSRAGAQIDALAPRLRRLVLMPDPNAAADLLDDMETHWLEHGLPVYDHHLVTPVEDELVRHENNVLQIYGAAVTERFRASLQGNIAGTMLNQNPVSGSVGVHVAQKMMHHNQLFLHEPSIENWNALVGHAQSMLSRALALDHSDMVGETAFLLDSSTRTFGVRLKMMQAYQHRRSVEIRAVEEISRELVRDEERRGVTPQSPQLSQNRPKNLRKSGISGTLDAPATAYKPDADQRLAESYLVAPELARIRRQIRSAVHSRYTAKALEGEVAQNIIDNLSTFSSVVGFNQIIMRDAKNRLGEIDVHLDNAVVECTLREAGKEKQLRKLVGDRTVNPEGKTVILYAPNYKVDAQRLIPKGVLVARDPTELGTALFALKAKSLGWLS